MKVIAILICLMGSVSQAMPTGAFDQEAYDREADLVARNEILQRCLDQVERCVASQGASRETLNEILKLSKGKLVFFPNISNSARAIEAEIQGAANLPHIQLTGDSRYNKRLGELSLSRQSRHWVIQAPKELRLDRWIERDPTAGILIHYRDGDKETDEFVISTPVGLRRFFDLIRPVLPR